MTEPLLAIVIREFKRFTRQRGRLLSTVARPLLWLFVIGAGFGGIVALPAGRSYQEFLFPGVIGMVMLFSAVLAALSTVYDRELGVMRMLLIAPVTRLMVVLGKLISSAALAAAQGLALLLLLPVLGIPVRLPGLSLTFLGVLMTSLALAGLGMLLASRIRSLENFAAVMNFVVFPIFFLSGALYPVERLPHVLQAAARVNPLTYGIDLLKHGIFGAGGALGGELAVGLDVAILATTAVLTSVVAAMGFGEEDRITRLLARGS